MRTNRDDIRRMTRSSAGAGSGGTGGGTPYTLPLAADGTRGGVQIGYTTSASARKYAVQLEDEKMYVNVPWTDHYAWADITSKPSWIESTKPSYTLDEVGDGTTRKLANYLPLAGGTMAGSLKIATGLGISDASDNGMLVYHPTSWTGVSNAQWGVGAADCVGVIRSNSAALKHYRNGDNTYDIIDSKGGQTIANSLQIGNSDGAYLQIGAIRLVYDSSNNAIKVIKSDGGDANFYATGGVSALKPLLI